MTNIHFTSHEGLTKKRTSKAGRLYSHAVWVRPLPGAHGEWGYNEKGDWVSKPRTDIGPWECTCFASTEQLANAQARRFEGAKYETVVKPIDRLIQK